jgi:prepilin-type N-terminal cleavage/methylation domain-containing protein
MPTKRPNDGFPARRCSCRRRRQFGGRAGFTILELEVAMVVFGIALMGICPLVVMYSKQLRKLEMRFNPQTIYYLVPSADVWARKLGAAASVATQDFTPTPPAQPATVNDVQIQSLEKSIGSEIVTAHVSVQAKP